MKLEAVQTAGEAAGWMAAHIGAMDALLGCGGWDAFAEEMTRRAANKVRDLRRPDVGEDGRLPDDYLRGWIDALEFVCAYPRHVHNTRQLPPG